MSAAEKVLSVRLSARTAGELEALSRRVDRPQARLLREAVESFLDRETYAIARIEAAIEQADRGEVVPHDEVMAAAQRIIDAARRSQ